MANITQMELNTLKQLIANEDLNAKKFKLYAQNCSDPQLAGFFNECALNAATNVRTLMSYLI
ncbi:MAG TPA: hypothetical protein PLC07_07135 [Bacillota bacterium]|nr:hypothetical protein [Bacillota bacterium]HPT88276.1 hypothetical protein [Bacillota bacterium]